MDRISTLNLHEHVIYPAIYQYGNSVGRDNRKSPKEDIIHFQYLIFPYINLKKNTDTGLSIARQLFLLEL